MKACRWCGGMFNPIYPRHQLCSKPCEVEERSFYGFMEKMQKYEAPKKCERCQAPFKTLDSRRRFCSQACTLKSYHHGRNPFTEQKRNCEYCGNVFCIRRGSGSGSSGAIDKKRFCTNRCTKLNFDEKLRPQTKIIFCKCGKVHPVKSKRLNTRCPSCRRLYKLAHRVASKRVGSVKSLSLDSRHLFDGYLELSIAARVAN